MGQSPEVTIEMLRKLVAIDMETGALTWKPRPVELFANERAWKSWNSRFAGRQAFNTLSGNGYMHGALFNKKIYAHRIVFALVNGRWSEQSIDHIDGNRLNNRPLNLRDVDHRSNCLNQPIRKANTSGFTGVSYDRTRGAYESYITSHGKKIALGRFATSAEAAIARAQANKTHGYHANHGRKQP